MTRNLLSTLILWTVCTILVFFCFVIIAAAQEDSICTTRSAHVGFIFPLSTNGVDAPKFSNGFSLHALAGVSREERAFCLSGISSIVKEDATGVMISGIYSQVGNHAKGVQISGMVNVIGKEAEGVQLAGFANVTGNANGTQVAGFTNVSKNVDGAQIAGFANSSKEVDVQVAGFSNVTKRSEALQLAGFINVAQEARTQVSGFINIARKVKGVQIAGFINVAEESNYPIGLINIIKNGEKQLGLTMDEAGTTMLAFRSGGKVLYGIIGAGYNFDNDNARYAVEGGIGAHFAFNKYFRTNLEITVATLSDLQYDVYMKSSTKLFAAFKIANRIEIFAGPSFNYLGYERGQADIRNDSYLWRERSNNHFNGLYIGATGGIQVNL
ncbi:MAG: hypothetical protein WC756_07395 [Taibaiella sp.]|jgi:hypothetical protein